VSCVAAAAVLAVAAVAQYPGQVAEKDKAPILRAVGVLEWTGDPGKPKKARLIPITIFADGQLQDGGVYMARPQPLGLSSEVQYILKQTGKGIGLFNIENAGQEQGVWVGYGKWNAMPAPKPDAPKPIAMVDENYDDRPVLHRKHHADDPAKPGGKDAGTKDGARDSDTPTLHRKDSADNSDAPAPDPDRPTLHKAKNTSDSDSDKNKPKKGKKQEDIGHVENLPEVTDPDRPRLKRGKSNGGNLEVVPSLMGIPPDMQQTVAVSDGRDTPEHPWVFHWANHDDELQTKAKLEAAARTVLGLDPPPAPPTPAAKTKTVHAKTRLTLPPAPAPLADEQFRVFELAYGAGATLVLTAHTDAPEKEQKFVTLVAQPDFYGGVQILLKNVTDARHLDDSPRLRLVDAVDAEADNRGELLFEARGATERHFVLYRVLRGQAEPIFTSAPLGFVAVSD